MSRIDEALRRAEFGDTLKSQHRSDLGILVDNEKPLDHYPREDHNRAESSRMKGRPAATIAAPRAAIRSQFTHLDSTAQGKLVLSSETSHVAIEQYRRMAATLFGLQSERGLKTLMVTSTAPQEGKTLTIANLALTFSESYNRKVLLIDADLRMPAVGRVFGLPNVAGLSEDLRAETSHLPIIQVSSHLSVVPAGQPDANPMSKLTSPRMALILKQAAASFDWVLLDAPPVGLMPDANLLARLTDAVIYVIGANSAPLALIERAINDLGRDRIVGTVLNRVDPDTLIWHNYYGGYYDGAETTGAAEQRPRIAPDATGRS
jgi:capsular exopolysaccharide synthesis family protein